VLRFRDELFSSAIVFILTFGLALLWPGLDASAQESLTPVKIGVLAKRGTDRCLEKWGPTAEYLTSEISGYSFTIVPLGFDAVYAAAEREEVDFILANPSSYVKLEMFHGVNRIATLANTHAGEPINTFGGVIFHRADRTDISDYNSLKGKTFMAVDKMSFGGWLTAWRELKEKSIDPYRDFADLRFGGTHDTVVYAVHDGKVDADNVRTDTLDRMVAEGKIRIEDFLVIHKHGGGPVPLPFQHSTRSYPEWPMAKLKHTSVELAKKVTIALLRMPPDSAAAKAAKCVGWTIPLNYQPVHDCLKELRVGPYEDYGKVTPEAMLQQYWHWFIGALFLAAFIIFVAAYVMRINRRLHKAVEAERRELTERKRAEEALNKEKNRMQMYLDIAGVILLALDQNGDIILVNKRGCEVLGYSESEMLGMNWFDRCLPAKNRSMVRGVFNQLMQGEVEPIEYYENTVLNKNDEERLIAWHNTLLKSDEGMIVGTLTSGEDITEQKKAEQALINSEKWLRTTLASVGDAVITTDVEGAVSFLNPTAQALTGWKLEDALGRPLTTVFNIINERTRNPVENPVVKVLREKKVVGLANHTVLISKDGVERPIADSAAPIKDDAGNVLGVVLVFRDMSKQRETEAQLRQRQKLESIGTLAGGVAHEINNPVGIVMNNAELILDDAEPGSDIEQNTQEIIRESKRIAVIVKNLLFFSRQEKESHSPALLADIVESTLSLTRKVFANNQITIEVDIPDDLPKLRCRSQQIQQVLMNLVANARYALNQRYPKYDKNKVIKITAQTFTRDDIAWIRISVEDHGAGISPKIMGRIFDPFFTTKPRDEGTGLGLSISHGIAREHQGELRVESQEGQYTRFHLELRVDNGWSLSQSGTDVKEND
jgi:PAS domain S-box-containing protein